MSLESPESQVLLNDTTYIFQEGGLPIYGKDFDGVWHTSYSDPIGPYKSV